MMIGGKGYMQRRPKGKKERRKEGKKCVYASIGCRGRKKDFIKARKDSRPTRSACLPLYAANGLPAPVLLPKESRERDCEPGEGDVGENESENGDWDCDWEEEGTE